MKFYPDMLFTEFFTRRAILQTWLGGRDGNDVAEGTVVPLGARSQVKLVSTDGPQVTCDVAGFGAAVH